MHFLTEHTVVKFLVESFWRDGTPPLAPQPVPSFTPHRWRTRADGIVV